MDVNMEAMMILKDDTAIQAEDGKNCQANTDVFQEFMGLTKYSDLFKIKLFCENIFLIFVIKRTHLESFYCWHF